MKIPLKINRGSLWKTLVKFLGTAILFVLLIGWLTWQLPKKLEEERVREEALLAWHKEKTK